MKNIKKNYYGSYYLFMAFTTFRTEFDMNAINNGDQTRNKRNSFTYVYNYWALEGREAFQKHNQPYLMSFS